MNLISTNEKSSYQEAMQDLHDTFARPIILVKQVKTPKEEESNEDDDYDFIQDHNAGPEEFVITETQVSIQARIKYIEKQDKDFALVSTLGGEQINLVQEFGLIRIKIILSDLQKVQDATNILVDGNNCNVLFRDRPHGLIESQFATFYLQRTP